MPVFVAVICCLVDGHVVALDSSGSIIWRVWTYHCLIFKFISFYLFLHGRVMLYVFASSMVTLCNFIILFQCRTGGPIFAGPCTSFALPSQVRHRLQVQCYKIVSYIFLMKLKISSITSTFVNKAVIPE